MSYGFIRDKFVVNYMSIRVSFFVMNYPRIHPKFLLLCLIT